MWICIAEIIPRGANKGIHSISLTTGRLATLWTGAVYKGLTLSQWRYRTLLELYILWQHYRQLILWYKLFTTVITVNNRNRCTPITLTGNQPVTETIVDTALTKALSLSLVHNALHSSLNVHARELSRIYQHTSLVYIGLSHFLQLQLLVLWLESNNNIQLILLSKHPVTLILRRNTNNRTSTVLSQYIISNPDFYLVAVKWVYRIKAGKDTFLFGLRGGTLQLRLILSLLTESLNLLSLWIVLTNLFNQRMLCCQGQEGNTIYSIRTGGISSNLLSQLWNLQIELQALTAANPVFLHGLYSIRPALQEIQILQQYISIISNLQEPLGQILLDNLRITAPALALNNLLIGQYCATGFTPVYIGLFLVSQTTLIEQLEEPLSPTIIIRAAGSYRAIPVIGQAHFTLLTLHIIHIGIGPVRWLYTMLNSSILCWHTKGIKTHWMNNIKALHSLVASQNITNGIIPHMAHMQIARWIWEHFQGIILWLLWVHLGLINILSQPFGLPFLFYTLG